MTIAITVLFVIALFVAGSEECFGKPKDLKSPALSQYSSGKVPTNLFVTAKGVSYNGTISNYVEPSVLFSDNGLSIILKIQLPKLRKFTFVSQCSCHERLYATVL